MIISRERLAWAGGLFEGEGSFSFARRGAYYSIVAELGMTDEDRVRQFHEIVRVGNVTRHVSTDPKRSHHKPVYVWKTASFEGTQAVIALLWSWLGPRRRQRATEILKDYKTKTQCRRFTLASESEVQTVKEMLQAGVSKRKIAAQLGRSYGFVNSIKGGRTHGSQ